MSVMDALTLVSNAQVVTASAPSTSSIDIINARDIGTGEPLVAEVLVTENAAASGSATVVLNAISADDAALTTNVVYHASTEAIPKATLVAGYRRRLPIPPESNAGADRYWGVYYTVATGPLTTGKFTAWIGPQSFIEQNNSHTSGLLMTGF